MRARSSRSWLADQDDLQQLLLRRLEIGQQPNLFEHVPRKVLGFVDDQDRAPAFGVRHQQEVVQGVDQRLDALMVIRFRNAEFLADRLQELERRELLVEHDRHVGVVGQTVLEEGADERGLAGADFSRELDETAGLGHTVDQMRERLAVALAHEQVAWIRRYRERLLVEAEKARIHSVFAPLERGSDSSPDISPIHGILGQQFDRTGHFLRERNTECISE